LDIFLRNILAIKAGRLNKSRECGPEIVAEVVIADMFCVFMGQLWNAASATSLFTVWWLQD